MKGLLTRIFNRKKTPATTPTPTQTTAPVPTPGDRREELRKVDKQQWEKLDPEVKAVQVKINELTGWKSPAAAPLLAKLQALQQKADEQEYQIAIGLFKGMKDTVATSHAACKKW